MGRQSCHCKPHSKDTQSCLKKIKMKSRRRGLSVCDTLHCTRKHGPAVPCGLMAASPRIGKTNQRLQTRDETDGSHSLKEFQPQALSAQSSLQSISTESRQRGRKEHEFSLSPIRQFVIFLMQTQIKKTAKLLSKELQRVCVWPPDSLVFPALPPIRSRLRTQHSTQQRQRERETQPACMRERDRGAE